MGSSVCYRPAANSRLLISRLNKARQTSSPPLSYYQMSFFHSYIRLSSSSFNPIVHQPFELHSAYVKIGFGNYRSLVTSEQLHRLLIKKKTSLVYYKEKKRETNGRHPRCVICSYCCCYLVTRQG